MKQGQIHGYRSRVRVGRGGEKKANLSIWVGTVIQMTPIIVEKVSGDRPTDGPTDIAGYRVA